MNDMSSRLPYALPANIIEQRINFKPRLSAVRCSGLLDTPPDESFDALTRMAARLVDAPLSFISVVDEGRDFYKSQVGFPPPLARKPQLTGRSFCHYTLDSDDALVIDDTHANAVWKAVPTVDSLGVRAYVGVPLKVDGENIGSFCVIDTKPRAWQPEELETIRQLALSAGREISLRLALASARGEAARSQALARSREEMVAVVAHDLRTPLQVLHLSTLILQRTAQGQQDQVIARMLTAIDAIKTMADGLLSAGALADPSADGRQLIDAAALARDAVDMMTPIAERAGISIVPGGMPKAALSIDYAQMLRVLGNLLGNAIKYSPTGGVIAVRGARAANMFSLAVCDNGRGMTRDEQAHAFDKGWQGAEGMVRGDGAGLGLSIVRTLVENHGGHVALSSEIGVGSTLTVSLPCT